MQSYDLSELSILVLEKHLLVRKLLTEVFSEFGVPSVHSTHDPEMAWDIFRKFSVDLILSDWTHDLDGMAFLNRIRKDPQSCDPYIPVVICTANSEYHHVCTARDAGMTEFLAKPVSATAIYERICSMIESTRSFIRVEKFFGPDRRRHRKKLFEGQERRRHAA